MLDYMYVAKILSMQRKQSQIASGMLLRNNPVNMIRKSTSEDSKTYSVRLMNFVRLGIGKAVIFIQDYGLDFNIFVFAKRCIQRDWKMVECGDSRMR